jgi:dTMP kinase
LELLDSFIVLEGLDGAGTTTQASLLTERLDRAGHRVLATSEPTRGNIGTLIRDVLAGRIETTPEALAMLYAADRHEHLYDPARGMIRALEDGWVVCDRYLFSSLAYQTVQCDYSLVYELNRRFPLPKHLVYVDVSPEMTEDRRRSRPAAEIFENLEFQRAVYDRYAKAIDDFSGGHMQVHVVDGSASPQDISEQIWKQLGITPIN